MSRLRPFASRLPEFFLNRPRSAFLRRARRRGEREAILALTHFCDCERTIDDGSVVVTVMVATPTRRVEVLETQMIVIATLPDRVTAVEAQVGLLRTEVHEFRTETKDEFAKVRQEAKDESSTLRQEMRDLNLETRQEMRNLSEQMREQLEETNRHMRVLHEEVIDRIRALGEGLDRRP